MPIRKPHPKAKPLRKDMPPAEQRLWYFIRRKQLGGFRFRRQHSIGPYIADFACLEVKLVIELDGEQHAYDDGARDRKRDAYLEQEGWTALRFWNHDVYKNIEWVQEEVLRMANALVKAEETEPGHGDEMP